MKLKENSFPLSFSLQETTDFIKQTLEEKNWFEFEVIEVKIVFVPYYFYSFEAFFESDEEGKKIVSDTSNGKLALNGLTGELDESISVPESDELVKEIEELPENIPFEEKSFELTEKIEQIVQIKTAHHLRTGKDNVIIHSIKKVLYPVWIIDFSVEEQTFQFTVSGVDGSVILEEEIPERELGFWEITSETLNELKSPSSWINYTTSVISDSANFVVKNTFSGNLMHNLLHNWKYQSFILLIILILIVLWSLGYLNF
ncbi:MAG: hypothetical protein COT90_05325 [Candidatus Diapherotrites archaeon CG10_big_fil_rev_8_21_14_0_10_31_34]|nr:MAG: hypothetical protein COT90_05325 [Candidatus Diapherotrites archaeon CG10_big_fil_rev_8_21_14_0_10_31_34]